MWETIAIILSLGGLEFTLWFLTRRAAKRDHEIQNKQLEILDGILTELAIQNSEDTTKAEAPQLEEVRSDNANKVGRADSTQEHPVCH
jgi:hypothetical protein